MTDMRKVFAIKKAREARILRVCPQMPSGSGIYVFYRVEEHTAYVGQAVNLLSRCAQHLGEYDHIGLSLKSHGLISNDNSDGWRVSFMECPPEELDERERTVIRNMRETGWTLYNKTSGGQGEGKKQIAEYKPPKGYRDGIKQGRKKLAQELSHIIDRHLTVTVKPGKEHNQTALKGLAKFNELLREAMADEKAKEVTSVERKAIPEQGLQAERSD